MPPVTAVPPATPMPPATPVAAGRPADAGPAASAAPGEPGDGVAARAVQAWRAGVAALRGPRPPGPALLVGGVRVGPIATRPIATALLAAVAPLTIAAPLIYLVGRHL
jgi:hypothetical protein